MNSSTPRITLFHSPQSRSTGVRALLKELDADYDLHVIDMKGGEQRRPAYLTINPMGKVPALLHGDALVTEQVAIYQYLAEVFPQAGLAPAIGDPLRGPYLRWLAFYGSCFEPAITDRAMKRDAAPTGSSPYGDFDTMWATFTAQLGQGPYLLGERFTSADVLWGGALGWMTMFKLLPEVPAVQAYIERTQSRPAVLWAREQDAQILAGKPA